jgi:hypothetical protein
VIYILGAGHCGSTLLGLLLNAHSQMVAVSELSKLANSIRDRDPVLDRPAWRATADQFERQLGARFTELDLSHPPWHVLARWSRADIEHWARPRAVLLRALSTSTSRPWIIDGSKSWQPLYLLARSELFDLRVLHLVRDARGVVHSYAKKYDDLRHGLAKWVKPSLAGMLLAPSFGERWLRVRYEDLAGDPSRTLERICAHIGVAFEPAMLRYRDREWLGIGGNRMSTRADDTIRLDERWRREMSTRDRLVVDLLGGALNRYYGYPLTP